MGLSVVSVVSVASMRGVSSSSPQTWDNLGSKWCDIEQVQSSSSLITEIETGRGVAIASPVLRHASGKRLLYRPLTGTIEMLSVGIARAMKGDVTPAGEKFCEILRITSGSPLEASKRRESTRRVN